MGSVFAVAGHDGGYEGSFHCQTASKFIQIIVYRIP